MHGNSISTYNNGQPYRIARGQAAPRSDVVNHNQTVHPIVRGFPTAAQFHRAFVRELKIRLYQPNTIRAYSNALRRFLRWFGNMPHRVTQEDARCFLEDLVDGGAQSDWVSQHLTVLRVAFDKLNGRQITLGLATPRKPKRMPLILSEDEVKRILEAAPSLRDKLFIGLMYATGMRVSEVTRLRWRDIDFDRRIVSVWQAKGRSDRQVTLPKSFQPLLKELATRFHGDDYLFPGQRKGKHLSTRTGERIVKRTTELAGIQKKVTPHSFRHAFATHLLEHGTDIRFIQKLLGHVRLETTTIYTRVATPRNNAVTSPLDRIHAQGAAVATTQPPQVGRLRFTLHERNTNTATFTLEISSIKSGKTVTLHPIVLRAKGPGWLATELPPTERWETQLRELDPACRARIESHEFFNRIQTELTKRFYTSG